MGGPGARGPIERAGEIVDIMMVDKNGDQMACDFDDCKASLEDWPDATETYVRLNVLEQHGYYFAVDTVVALDPSDGMSAQVDEVASGIMVLVSEPKNRGALTDYKFRLRMYVYDADNDTYRLFHESWNIQRPADDTIEYSVTLDGADLNPGEVYENGDHLELRIRTYLYAESDDKVEVAPYYDIFSTRAVAYVNPAGVLLEPDPAVINWTLPAASLSSTETWVYYGSDMVYDPAASEVSFQVDAITDWPDLTADGMDGPGYRCDEFFVGFEYFPSDLDDFIGLEIDVAVRPADPNVVGYVELQMATGWWTYGPPPPPPGGGSGLRSQLPVTIDPVGEKMLLRISRDGDFFKIDGSQLLQAMKDMQAVHGRHYYGGYLIRRRDINPMVMSTRLMFRTPTSTVFLEADEPARFRFRLGDERWYSLDEVSYEYEQSVRYVSIITDVIRLDSILFEVEESYEVQE